MFLLVSEHFCLLLHSGVCDVRKLRTCALVNSMSTYFKD